MSSRSSRRSRGAQSGRQKLSPAVNTASNYGFGWKLGFAVTCGVVLVLIIVWYGARGKPQPVSPALATMGTSNGSGGIAQDLPRSGRRKQADEAFKTQINHGSVLLAEGKPEEALQVLSEAKRL